jgi:beta-glucosidase
LQLYVTLSAACLAPCPSKELQGFERVYLEPGEEKEVKIEINPYAISYWDESEDSWRIEAALYKVIVSTS